MRLPAPLLRRNPNVFKNTFGHVLVLAGSPAMLGAAALTSLSAMRSGAGLVTVGIPRSLNSTLQKKISPVVMTWPLPETTDQTLSAQSVPFLKKKWNRFNAIALGPGMSLHSDTKKCILKIIQQSPKPLVIDADALNALTGKVDLLTQSNQPKILTPHPGEMARLTAKSNDWIESHREEAAKDFARRTASVILLKGNRSIVASPDGKIYTNATGNSGMATAGSGDVLTGMIAAFLAQGLSAFDAAKFGAYLHGQAGDIAAKKRSKTGLIATDIIESIPDVFR